MKSGHYTIQLTADGYAGDGVFDFSGRQGRGHDGAYQIELQLTGTEKAGAGIVNVLMNPAVTGNGNLPAHFSLTVTGTVDDDRFNLIGTGPLGIIIGLSGRYEAELDS